MMHPWEAAAREAERLRVIISTLAYSNPSMTMDEAVPIILATEKRTAELEAPQMPKERIYPVLADTEPATGAAFIDLLPDVQESIHDGKLIDGIKKFRAVTGWGLAEAKYACQHWNDTRIKGLTPPSAPTTLPHPRGIDPESIADWIDTQPDIIDMLMGKGKYATSGKIHGVKETRHKHPGHPGLKEAKEGAEHWIDTRIPF